MFGLFKKKTEIEKLTELRNKLLKEVFDLSKIDRKAADAKQAEAEAVSQKIDELTK